uniref:Uncharacterized protein n=1 Tax=Romanomermis culicivorax TaxID=13658 RepID=A0A915HP74_ROMCU
MKRVTRSKDKKYTEDTIRKARRQKIHWIRKCFFNPIGCA